MSNHITAGSNISLRQMSNGSVSAYIEFILDAVEGVLVRTVDFELVPVEALPGSKEWMKDVITQVIEYL